MLRDCACSVARAPHLPGEVCLIQPALIDVDNPAPRLEQAQHLESILLAKHKTTFRISLDRHFLYSAVAKSKFLLHCDSDLGQADINIMKLFHVSLHLSSLFDRD